jgi:hypothetical protein
VGFIGHLILLFAFQISFLAKPDGGHGPDSTPTKPALSEIGASLAKPCWMSSISAGVICLFIFFSSSRFDFGAHR